MLRPRNRLRFLRLDLEIGRASGRAFDIGMGDVVRACGFGPEGAAPVCIRAASKNPRHPAHEVVEFDGTNVRKAAPIAPDLNSTAKGYGVDRRAETLHKHGIADGLVGIDSELRVRRPPHKMDPKRGAPLIVSPASVNAVARTCAEADAWATACMVKGRLEGAKLTRKCNLSALFIDREGDHLRDTRVGRLFETRPDPERVS